MVKQLYFLLLLLFPVIVYSSDELLNAVENGDTIFINNYKGDFNETLSQNGETALLVAAYLNKIDVVKALINLKVDIEAEDSGGNNALIYASKEGNTEILKMLLKAKANVNKYNKQGITPLITASFYGKRV
ncbi:MAG: hypothetical protein A2Y33_04425 [Spirochaetes bacterium GWF1_51_8]|nr:MAG: hypothetical protein A2Y33_04425 [Spirochaetes bacterium GWF1_51_8]